MTILVVVAVVYPGYPLRHEFVGARSEAELLSTWQEQAGAFAWIMEHTQITDVFLASTKFALLTVTPSGRKVVATEMDFSNPFVDWNTRASDRDLMSKYLSTGNYAGFSGLASNYHLSFILSTGDESKEIDKLAPFFLQKVFVGEDGTSIYQVAPSERVVSQQVAY